jgi:hypothetical protein
MTILWIDFPCGTNIHLIVERAIKIAEIADDVVKFDFNGTPVQVAPTHVGQVVARYWKDRGED